MMLTPAAAVTIAGLTRVSMDPEGSICLRALPLTSKQSDDLEDLVQGQPFLLVIASARGLQGENALGKEQDGKRLCRRVI